jgi:hypothetical protein
MTLEELKAAGYNRYEPPITSRASYIMSKWIKDKDGTKLYAIHFYVYDAIPGRTQTAFAAEAIFYSSHYQADGMRMDVTFNFLEKISVAEIEKEFEDIYCWKGCQPDPHNQ